MKRIFFQALVSCKVFCGLPLLEDYHKAKELAMLYEKPLGCIVDADGGEGKLEEIIKHPAFAESLGNDAIFVKMDPLKEAWEAYVCPMLVLLDKEGREITRLSYREEGREKFAEFVKSRLATYHKLCFTYEKAKSEEELQDLYQIAADLGTSFYQEKILDKGLKLQEGVFFPLERYTRLINEGKRDTEEAKEVRRAILKRDPENQKGARLRLALLDFQEGSGEPEMVIAPLGAYIQEFGEKDRENLWRLHMLIAEYMSAHGKSKEAKKHAERSIAEAPISLQKEVSALLEDV